MENSCANNWRDFQKETNIYEVEPMIEGQVVVSWINLSEVSDNEKARTVDFNQIKGKKLYAKFVRANDKSYWKMYIVDYKNVGILYLNTSALNPVRLYRP